MKRLLFYIFIPVLAFLLMSHNANAATLNVPVHMQATFDNPKVQCNTQSGWTDMCATSSTPIYFIKMATYNLDNFAIPTGNYYVEIILRSEGNLSITSASSFITADIPSSTTLSPIEVEQLAYSSSGAYQYYTYRVLCKYTGSATPPVVELGVTWNKTPWLWGGATGVDHITFWRIDDENAGSQDIVNAINNQSQQEQNAANDIENQSPSDIGNSTNAETQSLLNAFGSFVSAIASISPSNCMVDFDLGHIDFGEQNLCSVSVPVVFTSITSIIVIMFTIPFVYHLVNRILGLIREMQT